MESLLQVFDVLLSSLELGCGDQRDGGAVICRGRW
jgi:hypothetical protein